MPVSPVPDGIARARKHDTRLPPDPSLLPVRHGSTSNVQYDCEGQPTALALTRVNRAPSLQKLVIARAFWYAAPMASRASAQSDDTLQRQRLALLEFFNARAARRARQAAQRAATPNQRPAMTKDSARGPR